MVVIQNIERNSAPIYSYAFSGNIDRHAVFDFLMSFRRKTEVSHHNDLLIDISQSDEIALGLDDFAVISNFIDVGIIHTGRSAYVSGSMVRHIMFADVFAGLRNTSKPGKMKVFNSREAALEWLS